MVEALSRIVTDHSPRDRTQVGRVTSRVVLRINLRVVHRRLRLSRGRITRTVNVDRPTMAGLRRHKGSLGLTALGHCIRTVKNGLDLSIRLPAKGQVTFGV